jgi:serpin B
MMSQLGKFGYAESDSLQVLELPYSGNALSAVVLLPRDKEGLPTLEEHLTWDLLSRWISQVSRQQVFVVLPKFNMASEFDLQDALRGMGVEDVFSPAHADLSGVSAERELYVSASVHKAVVRVDEEGTEAAAATAMVGSLGEGSEGPPIFLADHPFIFVVRYVPTGDIMFIGRLVMPLSD